MKKVFLICFLSISFIGYGQQTVDEIKDIFTHLDFLKESHDDFYDSAYTIIQAQIAHLESQELAPDDFNQIPLALWHSSMADLLRAYSSENLYRITHITPIEEAKNQDFKTWDLLTLTQQIIFHYQQSLKFAFILQQVPVTDFAILLQNPYAGREYRPTVYDMLAHRFLDFLSDNYFYYYVPKENFQINDSSFFADNSTFIHTSITSPDSLSFSYLSLLTYQKLTQFHLKSGYNKAYIDISLERIKYIYQQSNLEQKNLLYESFLLNLAGDFSIFPGYEDVCFALGDFYEGRAALYQVEKKDEYREDYNTAIAWYEKAIQFDSSSISAHNAAIRIAQILAPSIVINSSQYLLPNKENLISCSYKNCTQLALRIIPISNKEYEKILSNRSPKNYQQLREAKYLHEWKLEVPYSKDHQLQISDIDIPALSPGTYLILASLNDFDKDSVDGFTYQKIELSNIGSFYTIENNTLECFFFNRTTGAPLKNIAVDVYYSNYNYKEHGKKRYKTDKNGKLTIPVNEKYDVIGMRINLKKDQYEIKQYVSQKTHRDTTVQVKLFTDRSIYRPGQTVYFKGIVIESSYKRNLLRENLTLPLKVYDVNWQPFFETKVTTNEFGSFSGSFTLPDDGLNGQFALSCHNDYHFFNVEAYKRPTFEITFQQPKEDYKLGEWVEITGEVTAFAGFPIDDATLNYAIVRNEFYPFRRNYQYNFYPILSEEQKIDDGTLTTDKNGKFTIKFKANAGNKSSFWNPMYHFNITVDATDITGETHEAEMSIPIGTKALILEVTIPEVIILDESEKKFPINAYNLSYEKQEVVIDCRIFQLEMPLFYLHQKITPEANTVLINEEKMKKLFPYLDFSHQYYQNNWKKITEKSHFSISTKEHKELTIPQLENFQQGAYVIISTAKDKFGEMVTDTTYFFVQKPEDKKCAIYQALWVQTDKESAKPGDELTVRIGSYLPTATIWVQLKSNDTILQEEWITLKQGVKNYLLPIDETHYGTITVSALMSHEGYQYQAMKNVEIPFIHKKINLELATLKDKLVPGSSEEWQISLKGIEGEKIEAEMLCKMYDASLDQFIYPAYANLYVDYLNLSYNNYYYYYGFDFSNHFYATNSYYYPFHVVIKNYKYPSYYQWEHTFNRHSFYYSSTQRRLSKEYDTGGVATTVALGIADFDFDETMELDIKNMEEYSYADNFMLAESGGEIHTFSVPLRTNFNETAFFYPHLKTNEEGNVVFSFTLPESFTKWRFQGLAHTKDLKIGYIERFFQAQKELMIVPNLPRFIYENDTLYFSAKVVNLSTELLEGKIVLELYDGVNGDELSIFQDANFYNFTLPKDESKEVNFKIVIPRNLTSLQYKIKAKTTATNGIVFSDGEEGLLPVLTSRLPIIESLPLYVNSGQQKKFTFEKLRQYAAKNKGDDIGTLTFEFTPNPIWNVVQAIPYITDYPSESNEQFFNKLYIQSVATLIVQSSPRIKYIIDQWATLTPETFYSQLEKNQELKNIVLEETPWVLEAKSESAMKQQIALLFDTPNIEKEKSLLINKLSKNQLANGAWGWIGNGYENRYITQSILAGFGHLLQLGIDYTKKSKMIEKGLAYLDAKISEDYQRLQKNDSFDKNKKYISYSQYHYLYVRSFFIQQYRIAKYDQEAYLFYLEQAKKYWKEEQSFYMQAFTALTMHRNDEEQLAIQIMEYIKMRAQYSEEMGMYWKKDGRGYYWYESPIERQSVLIEAFHTILDDVVSIEKMKQWLLKQKQTQHWGTARSTVDACYALLFTTPSQAESPLLMTDPIFVSIGKETFEFTASTVTLNGSTVETEAGSGYYKTAWQGGEITPDKANITIKHTGKGSAWGALYWRYLEEANKITPSVDNPFTLKKRLYLVSTSDRGEVLMPITSQHPLKVGSKVRVRLEITIDRDLEFVHLKDMRAAAFEPIEVLSTYRYQNGLSYYESTRDAATHFFFDYLPKGTYQFEYTIYSTLAGTFTNGLAMIQCEYAPEFSAHSEGISVKIEK